MQVEPCLLLEECQVIYRKLQINATLISFYLVFSIKFFRMNIVLEMLVFSCSGSIGAGGPSLIRIFWK